MNKNKSIKLFLLLSVLSPVFFVFKSNQIEFFRGQVGFVVLPLSFFCVLFLPFLSKNMFNNNQSSILILKFFIYYSLFLAGISCIINKTLESILYLIQTLVPIAFYFLGRFVGFELFIKFAPKVIKLWVIIVSIPLFKILLKLSDKSFLESNFFIYQLHDYFPILLVLGLFLFASDKKSLCSTLFSCVTLVTIFFCKSKNIILAMLISYLFFKIRDHKIFQTIITCSLCFLLFLVVDSPAKHTFSSSAEELTEDISFKTRLQSLENSITLLQNNILFGLKYRLIKEKINYDLSEETPNSHNQYVTIALRCGLIGFFLYFSFVFRESILFFKNSCHPQSLKMFILFVLISSIFQDNLIQPFSGAIFFFLLGIKTK